jgi:DUF971 family protein
MAVIDDPVFIRTINQKNRYWFTIEWSDGKLFNYHLSELQLHCPCACCHEERTGKQWIDHSRVDEVTADRIVSVGSYGLQIFFTKGCSKGIYPFRLLRQINHQYPNR